MPEMTYLVTYELKSSSRNYEPFFSAAKMTGDVFSVFQNVFVLRIPPTSNIRNVDELSHYLGRFLEQADRLLIYDITGRRPNGLMTKESWSHLNLQVQG